MIQTFNTDEKFSIEIDVAGFEHAELSVEYDTQERELIVEGHQKERANRVGSIQRDFKHKFPVPDDTCTEAVAAFLSPTNKLTIVAPKKGKASSVRRVPIQFNAVDQKSRSDPDEVQSFGINLCSGKHPEQPNENESRRSIDLSVENQKNQLPNGKDEKIKPTERLKKLPKIKREYLNIFC